METLILNPARINKPGDYWSLTEYPDYKEIAEAGEVDRWILVDVRPLRGHVHSGAITLSPEVERAVFGSDAFLLMAGASRGTVSWR